MLNLYDLLIEDYSENWDIEGLSGNRLANRLHKLAQIGLTKEGGSNRIGYSKEEQAAKEKVMNWMKEAGMKTYQDDAKNVFGIIEGFNKELPAIMIGSHVDTVPNGGHFDGTLGVLSALEVIQAMQDEKQPIERTIVLAIFSNEEGACFQSGFTGSKALTKSYKISELESLQHGSATFEDVMEQNGSSLEKYAQVKMPHNNIGLFLEIHIEQGKILEKANQACGIVTGIAGPLWLEVTIRGVAGHAGNTPMDDRHDALVAASKMISKLPQIPPSISDSAVATVGKMSVHPNGINVIPGEVTFSIDLRDIHLDKRNLMYQKVVQIIEETAKDCKVETSIQITADTEPVLIKDEYIEEWKNIFYEYNKKPIFIPSGAGHDAMVLADKIPVSMLFVRSKDGVSHHPAEWSSLNDCMEATFLLKKFIEKY